MIEKIGGARYYGSMIGRWLTPDPLADMYPGFSSYVYTANNPLRYIDPDGRYWEDHRRQREQEEQDEMVRALEELDQELAWQNDLAMVAESGRGNTTRESQFVRASRKEVGEEPEDGIVTAETSPDVLIGDPISSAVSSVRTLLELTDNWLGLSLSATTKDVISAFAAPVPGGVLRGATSLGKVVTFGHGARHLRGTELTAKTVESAIKSEVQLSVRNASGSGKFWGRIQVQGRVIEYRAYTLPNGRIHVGTYYPIK